MTGLTARLAALISDRAAVTTDAWCDVGERAVVDTVGVMFAGAKDPVVTLVAAGIDETGGSTRSVVTGKWMSTRSAALVDGTSAHALDYDDVDSALIAHPSAVLVPALFAAGQARDASGLDILSAYRVGLQASRIVGAALGVTSHYGRGWHATSTIGTIGAAAAVSHLLGLSEGAARYALGIAGSLACGSRQNFGTMTKPLHCGLAAANGILAARLAQSGFTADADQLDGPLGFLALFGAGRPAEFNETDLLAPRGLNVKRFPCCYYTQPTVEAALELHHGFNSGDVVSIEVAVQPGGLAPLIHHRPIDSMQAKFSLEYIVAACLLDGRLDLASFEEDRVRRDDVQHLLRRVSSTEMSTPPHGPADWTEYFAVVTIRGKHDSRQARVDLPLGHVARPLSEEQARDKLIDCLGDQTTGIAISTYKTLRNLRNQPSLRKVMAGLRGATVDPATAARASQIAGSVDVS